jgi:hypothetical protein
MITLIVITCFAGLLVAAGFVVKWRQRQAIPNRRDQNLAQLEEVLRTAQLTNSSFFQSLELVQKNLESLLARAESAEQRLRNLMLQPGVEKKDQYTAAALLLGEGQEPQRVASMLNLPLPQVQIVRDLQKMAGKEKKNAARRKIEAPSVEVECDNPAKAAALKEKTSAYPMRLVDVIRKAANEAAKQNNEYGQFTGINA